MLVYQYVMEHRPPSPYMRILWGALSHRGASFPPPRCCTSAKRWVRGVLAVQMEAEGGGRHQRPRQGHPRFHERAADLFLAGPAAHRPIRKSSKMSQPSLPTWKGAFLWWASIPGGITSLRCAVFFQSGQICALRIRPHPITLANSAT